MISGQSEWGVNSTCRASSDVCAAMIILTRGVADKKLHTCMRGSWINLMKLLTNSWVYSQNDIFRKRDLVFDSCFGHGHL